MNFSHYSVFLDVDPGRPIAWFIAIIGLPLNIFIICFMIWESSCIRYYPRKPRPSNTTHILKSPSLWLLFNLFTSDLFDSIYALILSISDVYYTNYYQAIHGINTTYSLIKNVWFTSSICTLAQIVGKMSVLMAATFTLLISIDRLILIVYPHSKKKFTIKSSRILSATIWIFGFVLIIGVAIYYQYWIRLKSPYTFNYYLNLCIGDFTTTGVLEILAIIELAYYLMAYMIVTVIYVIIIWRLRKSRLEFHSHSSSISEKRLQIMFILIAFTNVFAFFFISISSFVSTVYVKDYPLYQKLISLLPFTNTVIDPVLYLIFRQNDIRKKIYCGPSNNRKTTIGPMNQVQDSKSSHLERMVLTEIQE